MEYTVKTNNLAKHYLLFQDSEAIYYWNITTPRLFKVIHGHKLKLLIWAESPITIIATFTTFEEFQTWFDNQYFAEWL